MRLICPNCAAQYEVDASMIPDEGRDVQCSSCGHTWFQRPDTAEEMIADEMGVTEADTTFDTFTAEPEPAPTEPPAPKPRPMDEAAREILRQEAAREAEARRREKGASLETQPDLGLTDPEGAETRAKAAKDRLARLRDTPDDPTEAKDATAAAITATVAPGSRRELLPDIEEINSTLTATGARADGESTEEEVEQAKTRSGFRFTFLAVFVIFVVAVIVYLFAPQIAQAVPALTPALSGYLQFANGLLDLIDDGLRSAIAVIQGLLGTADGNGAA